MKTRTTRAAKRALNSARTVILASLARLVIRFLRFTWRVRIAGEHPPPSGNPLVFCFWHGRQSGLFAYPHNRRVAVLSSFSRDGTLQAEILKGLGFTVHRGSSSKGGASGLKGIVKELKTGTDSAFAVDGPRGPAFKAKRGAIEAASLGGALLVPMGVSTSSAWVATRAWDRYMLPLPFSCVTITVGKALKPDETSEEKLEDALNKL